MNSVHEENWKLIVCLLQSKAYEDLNKFYSVRDGWCWLTDKFGMRYELGIGNTVNDFIQAVKEVRETYKYTKMYKQYNRIYKALNTPPHQNK